jgi:hypothetical protein
MNVVAVAILPILLLAACQASDSQPPDRSVAPEPTTSQTVGREAPPVPKVRHISDKWRLSKPSMSREIEAYATEVSGTPGTRVGLKVSTDDRSFRAAAWRIGAYDDGDGDGNGLRVWRSRWLPGKRQAEATFASYDTRTIVARWRSNITVDTSEWPPGFYLFKLTTRSGWQRHVPYVVSSPSAAGTIALVAPFTTYQAYNQWGGYSLYDGPDGDRRSWAVSFDRPWWGFGGVNDFRRSALPLVVLAEELELPLSYFANVDLHTRPHALVRARGYVSLGHDEYWTPAMRRRVLAARDAGTNLAFLGANTMYWRVRLEGRRMVGYRADAHLDPLRDELPAQATSRFRDAPSAMPENDLVGMLYECYPVSTAYRVVAPKWWGFRGTGVRYGDEFANLVGPESDRVYPNDRTPRPMQVLSHSHFSCRGTTTSTQSVYYTTPEGAAVFSAGTLNWVCALVDRCDLPLGRATGRFVRIVSSNLLRVYARGPAGARRPAHDNVDEFDLSLVNSVSAS